MTIAYVMYKMVQIAGEGYPPIYKSDEADFEGGQYTDGTNYVGYLFGTETQIEKAIEKAKPNGMQEIKIDKTKAFILTNVPINTEILTPDGSIKYSGLPEADVDGRLNVALSDTEWDQATIDAADAQIEKGNAMFELAETDFEMARVFEDWFTYKYNGVDFPTVAKTKIDERRAIREKVTGEPVTYPDWRSFRNWLHTSLEGIAVMERIKDSNSVQVAVLNSWLMYQLGEGDYDGVVSFAAEIDAIVSFTETEKTNVNNEALECNLPGPIFS